MSDNYRRRCREAVTGRLRTLLKEEGTEFATEFLSLGLHARADVVTQSAAGKSVLGMVRSGSWSKRGYLMEAAFTLLAAVASGRDFDSVIIYRPRKGYRRSEPLDAAELLISDDVTAAVQPLLPRVETIVQQMRVLASDGSAEASASLELCGRAGECGYCSANGVSTLPIDDPRTLFLGKRKGRELVRDGITSLNALPQSVSLSRRQQIQLETLRLHQAHVDRAALHDFTVQLCYPLRFLDFEAFSLPVPPYTDTRVWEHIPYLYTVQTVSEPGAPPKQSHYCAPGPDDFRGHLVQQLVEDIGTDGTVVVFGRDFEARMLRRLGAWMSGYAHDLEAVVGRLIDLSQPFREFWYYHPEQRGSLSMKTILPLLGDTGYQDLSIKNGLEANMAFATAVLEKRSLHRAQAEALTAYCARDTSGMVMMTEALVRLCRYGSAA